MRAFYSVEQASRSSPRHRGPPPSATTRTAGSSSSTTPRCRTLPVPATRKALHQRIVREAHDVAVDAGMMDEEGVAALEWLQGAPLVVYAIHTLWAGDDEEARGRSLHEVQLVARSSWARTTAASPTCGPRPTMSSAGDVTASSAPACPARSRSSVLLVLIGRPLSLRDRMGLPTSRAGSCSLRRSR